MTQIAHPTMHPLSARLRRVISVLMLSLAMLLFAAGPAAADHDPDVDVTFKSLRVYKKKGDVMLDYKISKSTWRDMRDANIEPRLNIYTPNRSGGRYVYRYSVPLKDRKGRILYNKRDVKLNGADLVKIELVGHNGAYRVGRSSFGSQCDDFLNVDVERIGKRAERDDEPVIVEEIVEEIIEEGPSRADVIKACDRQSTYSSDLDDCVEEGMKIPFARRATKIIDACGAATSYASGLESCIKYASQLVGRPVSAIEACDAATSYDSEVKSCMKRAVKFNHRSAGAVIAACDTHTSYSSDLNSCVEAASELGSEHVAIVNACGDATTYSSELRRCIRRAR